MDAKARVLDCHKDWKTKKYQLVLEVDHINENENLQGEKRVILKDWREKRSLEANAYMWQLLAKMALVLNTTKDELYEDYLQHYPLLDHDDNGYITITIRADIDPVKHLPGHWKYDKDNSKNGWSVYRRIRGTSEMDTKEMSWFLDRIVEGAKELGVETLTPNEMERLKGYVKK